MPTWVSLHTSTVEYYIAVDVPASVSSEFHSRVRFADELVKVFDNLRFDSDDDSFDSYDDFDDSDDGFEGTEVERAENAGFEVGGL